MKKLIYALLCAAVAAISFLVIECKDKPEGVDQLCGGYSEMREPTDEELTLFYSVTCTGEFVFTPLSVSTQVVAGLNYRFWCRYDDKTGSSTGRCFITIYHPLQGEPVLSKIEDEKGGPQMKVATDKYGNTARCIGESESSVHCETQDDYWVPRDSVSIELIIARCGQGIITLKEPGSRTVFCCPDATSRIVGTMVHEEGYVPEVYRCLGYINGWFLTEIDGKAGFIQEDLVIWDAINTF